MAEVHEISRRAFNELSNGPRWYDGVRSFGDYVVVHAYARFAGTPYAFFEVEHFDTEYWACRRCDGMQEMALYNGVLGGCEGRVSYYEVWHIVDDADDVAETLESLRQLREAGALDGVLSQDPSQDSQGNTWEDDLDELLLSGSGSTWWNSLSDETIEKLDSLSEEKLVNIHDTPYEYMHEGGKVQNWHLLIKFDGDDNEYRLTSSDDARDFITTIESIYQLEETSINN